MQWSGFILLALCLTGLVVQQGEKNDNLTIPQAIDRLKQIEASEEAR